MKKITFILVVGLLSIFETNVFAGDYPNGNLTTIINGANDGEIIVLTGDTYSFTARITSLTKSLTIKASPTLSAKPVITVGQAGVQFLCTSTSLVTLSLDGLEINGNSIATGLTQGKCGTGGDFKVNINNCHVYNFQSTGSVYLCQYTAIAGLDVYNDLTITNSKIVGPFTAILNTASKSVSPNNITFRNCLFKTFTLLNSTINVVSATPLANATLDHCTFDNCSSGTRKEFTFPIGTPTLVKNCIFINCVSSGVNTVGATNASNTNNTVYNSGVVATRYPNLGTISTSNPTLSGDYSTTPVGLGYYNAASISNSGTLTSFSYTLGAGPSAYQSFTVGGTDLYNNLTVSAPSGYELCLTTGGTYTSSLTIAPTMGVVASTTVYIRLAADLSVATYNGNVVLSSLNATNINIACVGTVNAGGSPAIIATGSPLSGFNYLYANGPSSSQSFSVSGSNLSAGITVTPSTNYEVSSDNSTFYSSAIVIGSAPTVTSTFVHVRLKAGLNGGSYNSESIGLTSGAATQQNVVCNGSVTPPTLTLTPTTLANFNAATGSSSPSSEKSFTVSGSNLDANITVTAPTNYEISTGTGGSFVATSPITILQANAGSPTTIYVRLKGSLATASYNENITVATAGAPNLLVSCAGVVSVPTISAGTSAGLDNKTTFAATTYSGVGPSNILDCYITGTNLVANITATAPTNFEISTNGTNFFDNITYTQSNGSVSGILYQRLKAGLLTDSYSGTVTLSSTSAFDRTFTVQGTVTGGPLIKGTNISTAVVTSLSAFSYDGNGPSTSNSNLRITCSGLTSDVTVTPPTNFEVSLDNTSFQTSPMTVAQDGLGNIATTTIYVRMKAGLAPNTYNQAITISATNANTRTVNVSGTVSSLITLSTTSKSNVDYAGNGPSPEYSFTVTGANMAGDITVTPPADYEVSTTSGSGYTLSPFTLSPSSGAISQILYFRLKAGLPSAAYSGEIIALAAANAATKSFTCSGTVTPATAPGAPTAASAIAGNASAVVSFSAPSSNGGSAITAYTVTSSPDSFTATGAASPLTVSGLANGTAYTFTVTATNSIGTGTASTASTAVTPNVTTVSTPTDVSTLTLTPTTNIEIVSGGELTLDATTTVNSIVALPSAKLIVNNGISVTGVVTLQSDASGTATLIDDYDVPTISATVQQRVEQGRNSYISAPVSAAAFGTLNRGTSVVSFNETTKLWETISSGTLTAGKGYIQVASTGQGSTGTVNFSGLANSGNLSVPLTRTGTTQAGYNLVGNPYPSYLDWNDVAAANPDLLTTMWFRTKTSGGTYVFATYNSSGSGTVVTNGASTSVSRYIPPMQAFWVRVNSVATTNLALTNAMRNHRDVNGNTFKAPKQSDQKLLRLQVSNGTAIDETVIYFNAGAADGYDNYDSPKMSNNSTSTPEIYTQVGTEKLVINGLSELKAGMEIPLGFVIGKAADLSITATEFANFDTNTKLFLKDNDLNTERELKVGTDYNFSSGISSGTNRFSLIFKSTSVSTSLNSTGNEDISVRVYKNANNHISIQCASALNDRTSVSVYNSVGQKLITQNLTSTFTELNASLSAGVYLVVVSNTVKSVTRKLTIN